MKTISGEEYCSTYNEMAMAYWEKGWIDIDKNADNFDDIIDSIADKVRNANVPIEADYIENGGDPSEYIKKYRPIIDEILG